MMQQMLTRIMTNVYLAIYGDPKIDRKLQQVTEAIYFFIVQSAPTGKNLSIAPDASREPLRRNFGVSVHHRT